MIPKTARQWELYTSKQGSAFAAKNLHARLTALLKAHPERSLDNARFIRDEMYVTMNKYRNYGARDTEPESILVEVIERELSLPEYSLTRS